ncbi:hypothetical protein, partial [Lactiplantibacillus plantarum]|uniref:hypothetical protein n=1 Tax=Lactiplantibacillus plantarum TaxID=1590 RepID=UPI001D07525D
MDASDVSLESTLAISWQSFVDVGETFSLLQGNPFTSWMVTLEISSRLGHAATMPNAKSRLHNS